MTIHQKELEIFKVNREDWPRCSRCEMPVEMFYVDIVVKNGAVLLVALCHGETEVIMIPPQVWDEEIPEYIEFGPAFGPGEEEPEWAKDFNG